MSSICSKLLGMARRRLEEKDDGESANEFNDGETLRTTMRVYGSLYLVLLVIFCFVRRRYRAYSIRNWAPKLKCDLASEQHGWISWMWRLYVLPEDDILDNCGMDALCFFRMLEFGLKISVVGCFNAVWLMPIYGTAPSSEETEHIDDRIVQVSVSHVPAGNPRLIATAFGAWIIFGYTMILILREFKWFTSKRHRFLSKPMPRNYTVYVSGIPSEYRSSSELLAFFRRSFSYDSVLEAHVALEIPNVCELNTATVLFLVSLFYCYFTPFTHTCYATNLLFFNILQLEKKVSKRDKLVSKLEHAIALEEMTGTTQTHLASLKGERVDSIGAYTKELLKLNSEVKEAIATSSFSSISEIGDDSTEQNDRKLNQQLNKITESTLEIGSKIGSAALAILNSEDGEPLNSGFVSFTRISTTNAALQMVHHHTPFCMNVAEAPNPEDIFWGNVGKKHGQLQMGKLIGLSLTVLLCFFWTIPVAFVTSLSSVDSLKESVPFLEDWIEKFPALEQLLAQLAPLFIVVLNAVLPCILIEFAKLEGPVSTSVLGE